MTRHPPDILITTPESLYLMLTSQAREIFAGAEQVILDEIHAVAQTKRGAHLALTLERLARRPGRDVQRIGLSATQNPLEEVGRFLVGPRRTCRRRRRRAQAAGPQDPRAGRVDGRAGQSSASSSTRSDRPRGDPQVDLAGDLPGDARAGPASTARRSSSSTTAAAPSGSRCASTSSPRSRSPAPTTARWRARSGP